jgi:hypothetical protein
MVHFFSNQVFLLEEISTSNPVFCLISKMGGLTDLRMWLHKDFEEKDGAIGKVHLQTQSFLVSIASDTNEQAVAH